MRARHPHIVLCISSMLTTSMLSGCRSGYAPDTLATDSTEECIGSLHSAYTVQGRVVGNDGCAARNVVLELNLVLADRTQPPNGLSATTDVEGLFRTSFMFSPLGHFLECMSEEEVLSIVSPDVLAPVLERIDMIVRQEIGPELAVSIPVTDDILPDFRPWDNNILDVGYLILVSVETCE